MGNYIAWTSGVITLLVLAAGFITYFSATRRVKEESREWFEKNTARLHREIEALQAKVQTASGEIDGHKEQVATSSKAALAHVQSEKNKFEAAASKILQTMRPEDKGSAPVIDAESAAVVQRASDELKATPESSFTAEDHYARGLSHFAKGNHLSALESFKAAFRALSEPVAPDELARYLFAEAIALGALGKSEEAIAVYDAMDSRFAKDESPGVREQLVRGLFNKAVRLGELGRLEQEIAVYDAIDRRFGEDESPGVREQVASALSNKGVRLGVLRKFEEEIAAYDGIDSRFGKDKSPGVREQVATALCNRGIRLGALGRLEEEIAAYDGVNSRFGEDESPLVREVVATALFNKGVRLSVLGLLDESIAVFEEIDSRFGKNELPGAHAWVAKARNGMAFGRIMGAKRHWQEASRKAELLATAIKGLESVLLICHDDDRAMVLGNLGYALLLSGNSAAAAQPTRECLRVGGEKSLAAQLGDTQMHRVEPEDADYEAMLAAVWAELHPPKELPAIDS